MLKRAVVSILLFFAVGNCPPARADAAKQKAVVGEIIAYYRLSGLACVGACQLSLIVRVTKPKKAQPQYFRVVYFHGTQEFPYKLLESRRALRLGLARFELFDAPLREFVRTIDSETGQEVPSRMPAWRLLPGAEAERLPFGETLPSFLLVKVHGKL